MVLKIIRAESGNDSPGVTKRQMYSHSRTSVGMRSCVKETAVLAVCTSPKGGQAQEDLLISAPPRLSL